MTMYQNQSEQVMMVRYYGTNNCEPTELLQTINCTTQILLLPDVNNKFKYYKWVCRHPLNIQYANRTKLIIINCTETRRSKVRTAILNYQHPKRITST